jgi:rhamnogalacturonyl hydrolase YesR
MTDTYSKIRTAMLAIQRYPWEQGVCAQALLEADDIAYIAMAHDAVLRQAPDGRLAVTDSHNIAVTDTAAVGEAVWRAYEHTGNDFYKIAAEKQLDYLMKKAPRTDSGLICHNDISFHEGFSQYQIWADSCYMLPPFLVVMNEAAEAEKQMDGYLNCLRDPQSGLLFHIYDSGTERFVSKRLWATGNGWALMGLARMGRIGSEKYRQKGRELLDSMLKFQRGDGLFHDTLDNPESFTDGTSAMMCAVFIYRGIAEGWLSRDYLERAESVYTVMQGKIDEYGIIRGVCGCPHFDKCGTSAEAQASYIMMHALRVKLGGNNEIR